MAEDSRSFGQVAPFETRRMSCQRKVPSKLFQAKTFRNNDYLQHAVCCGYPRWSSSSCLVASILFPKQPPTPGPCDPSSFPDPLCPAIQVSEGLNSSSASTKTPAHRALKRTKGSSFFPRRIGISSNWITTQRTRPAGRRPPSMR